jgi:hypothetical protein
MFIAEQEKNEIQITTISNSGDIKRGVAMVKTRSELEQTIVELMAALEEEKEMKRKIELECEKLRQGLTNALVSVRGGDGIKRETILDCFV